MSTPAVVLLSGGQDSTTCFRWAQKEFGEDLIPVSFDYGQKHRVELDCAVQIACDLGYQSEHRIFTVPFLSELPAALTQPGNVNVEAETSDNSQNVFAHEHGLPSTFVPGRNMLFFTMAAAYGATLGIYDLVTGVCGQDAAGYPDCRQVFVQSAECTLRLALDDHRVNIHAPLVTMNKAETWRLADELGFLDFIRTQTHTCYHGTHDDEHLHEWGYGCGTCPACVERAKGYTEFMEGHFARQS